MKRTTRAVVSALLASSLAPFIGIAQSSAQQDNNGQSEIQRGFSIAPVLLDLSGKQRGLVGLGSYYVNGVSDCIGCHTADGGQYLGGGRPFGPVLSRNLTPDFAGLPGGLTLEQFKAVMRSGVDFKNVAPPGPLIVMPWPAYQIGTDRWTEAVYEYLRAIPCVEGGPGTSSPRC